MSSVHTQVESREFTIEKLLFGYGPKLESRLHRLHRSVAIGGSCANDHVVLYASIPTSLDSLASPEGNTHHAVLHMLLLANDGGYH